MGKKKKRKEPEAVVEARKRIRERKAQEHRQQFQAAVDQYIAHEDGEF